MTTPIRDAFLSQVDAALEENVTLARTTIERQLDAAFAAYRTQMRERAAKEKTRRSGKNSVNLYIKGN